MSTAAWNFMLAEAGIVNKLTADLQTGPDRWARLIGTRTELAAVTEDMQMAPAVYVVYDGFAVLEADEYQAKLLHRWFVVIAVSDATKQREAAPRNQVAGPYMRDVLASLHGYWPPECKGALIPVTPPKPYYSDAKFAYFPLAFTVESFSCSTAKPF